MKSKALLAVGVLLILGISVAASSLAVGTASDACPGKIVCPLSGEEVYKDQCPLIDENCADCPGKIECPLTGELVCRDRCPINAESNELTAAGELPSCCQAKLKQ